jgi:hypothetical protein
MGRTGVAVIFAVNGVVRLCSTVIARARPDYPLTSSAYFGSGHSQYRRLLYFAWLALSCSFCRVSTICRLRLRKSCKYCNITRAVDLYP